MTLVVKRQNPISDTKKITSLESSTPRWKLKKWVITLKAETVSTSQAGAH